MPHHPSQTSTNARPNHTYSHPTQFSKPEPARQTGNIHFTPQPAHQQTIPSSHQKQEQTAPLKKPAPTRFDSQIFEEPTKPIAEKFSNYTPLQSSKPGNLQSSPVPVTQASPYSAQPRPTGQGQPPLRLPSQNFFPAESPRGATFGPPPVHSEPGTPSIMRTDPR